MKIIFNENKIDIKNNISINKLLEEYNINPATVVTIVNGDITDKKYVLQQNDRIDIITFAGGG